VTLSELIERERPQLIAAAWKSWHSRHGGRIGPGPAFSEAIDAILARLSAQERDDAR
jgi:hypothetical protein